MAIEIVVAKDGRARMIYSDDVIALLATLGGDVEINRASHVEPDQGGWTADLSPVEGPLLGPFRLRSEALAAEFAWLIANGTPVPK